MSWSEFSAIAASGKGQSARWPVPVRRRIDRGHRQTSRSWSWIPSSLSPSALIVRRTRPANCNWCSTLTSCRLSPLSPLLEGAGDAGGALHSPVPGEGGVRAIGICQASSGCFLAVISGGLLAVARYSAKRPETTAGTTHPRVSRPRFEPKTSTARRQRPRKPHRRRQPPQRGATLATETVGFVRIRSRALDCDRRPRQDRGRLAGSNFLSVAHAAVAAPGMMKIGRNNRGRGRLRRLGRRPTFSGASSPTISLAWVSPRTWNCRPRRSGSTRGRLLSLSIPPRRWPA